jgi:DNA sulfur modification protein DndC
MKAIELFEHLQLREVSMVEQLPTMTESTIERLHAAQRDLQEEYLAKNNVPWIIGYSGGKDSTLLAQLVFEMLLDLAPSDRTRPIHLLCNDTLVESPILMAYIDRMLARLQAAADNLHLPITVVKTTPDPDQTFWVNLIGRGYPAPTRMFRWCTDRMKIAPTSNYIRTQISANGEVVLLLGVRRAESANRARTANQHRNRDGTRLNPHDDLKGCMVFRPLMEMTTDDVWLLLLQRTPPWGGSHRELVTLYRNAQGGECPLVMDKSSAPSCGTSSSRFGCWTCTVVDKDRSMEAMIDSGHEHLEPLMDFRDWLAEFRNERSKRMIERRDGRIALMGDGLTTVAGPFTIEARQEILKRLLTVQADVQTLLISEDEIARIRAIWAHDAVVEAKRHLKQREQLRAKESV